MSDRRTPREALQDLELDAQIRERFNAERHPVKLVDGSDPWAVDEEEGEW